MSEFIQSLLIICVFTVIMKPNKLKIKSKKGVNNNGDSISEVCITLENETKKES